MAQLDGWWRPWRSRGTTLTSPSRFWRPWRPSCWSHRPWLFWAGAEGIWRRALKESRTVGLIKEFTPQNPMWFWEVEVFRMFWISNSNHLQPNSLQVLKVLDRFNTDTTVLMAFKTLAAALSHTNLKDEADSLGYGHQCHYDEQRLENSCRRCWRLKRPRATKMWRVAQFIFAIHVVEAWLNQQRMPDRVGFWGASEEFWTQMGKTPGTSCLGAVGWHHNWTSHLLQGFAATWWIMGWWKRWSMRSRLYHVLSRTIGNSRNGVWCM